jgi:hypothetical protein
MTINVPCDCCDFSGLTIQCSRHPLMGGKNLTAQLVKELHQSAIHGGLSWGDIIYEQEQEVLAAETPEQKVERLLKVEKETEKSADGLKDYELKKLAMINTDAKTGELKRKSGRCCRDAEEPAKWVVGKRKLGNYKEWAATDPKATKRPSVRPAGVPADAIFWSYGCEPHAKGCCPHLHPDEPGYKEAKANNGKSHGAADALMAKAVYLSNKPAAPKPSPLNQQVPVMRDAW